MRLSLLLILSACVSLSAQNIKTQPKAGVGALRIVYYRIDFTQAETDYLRTHTPELIFSVSEQGVAKLEKVNDIDMRSIVDSLMNLNDRLPEFYPETVNGVPQVGVYFLKLKWPNYNSLINPVSPYIQFYNPVVRKLKDFDEITYRNPRYDMVIGFFGTSTSGNLRTALANGWGTKFDFMLYGKNGWGGGFLSTIIFGRRSATDPSLPVRSQLNTNMMYLVSGAFAKLFRESNVGQFSLQAEPSFGIISVTGNNTGSTGTGVAYGFSPGISAIYMLKLGQGRIARQYFMPVSYKNYLSFHVAARQIMFNKAEARGSIFEFGLSYRLATQGVVNYKLKE